MNDMEVEQRVRKYLLDSRKFYGSPETLTSDYRLIEKGVLDSVGIFEMLFFLEEHYSIQIGDKDLTPENFGSLKTIAKLVAAKAGACCSSSSITFSRVPPGMNPLRWP
jgi:acyl carrier protein